MKKVSTYLRLTKPERTLTNVFTAAAGYLFVSRWHVHWNLLAILAGSTLIIASACVLNNFLDRGMDAKMARTKKRALVRGDVSTLPAIIYALVLAALGFYILSFTNWLTFVIGAVAFIGYVILYDLAKRYTVHSTLVGTMPGGASLVAGYTTVSGHLDSAAWMLFIIMVAWQMAHFYAIAIYRRDDYAAAGLPVMSIKYGVPATKVQVIIYIFIFTAAAALLSVFGHAGILYRVLAIILGIYWLAKSFKNFNQKDTAAWARGVFKTSLSVLIILMILIVLAPKIP